MYFILIKFNFLGKLLEGVSMKKCIDDSRKTIFDGEPNFERIHLLTRQDLRNIGNAKGIFKKERRHENDLISVDLFVEESKILQQNSPVVFYKKQGDFHQILSKDVFCLILISPEQKEMLSKFGENKICIDSTHGTNSYDFQVSRL